MSDTQTGISGGLPPLIIGRPGNALPEIRNDPETGALYIKFREAKQATTVQVDDEFLYDLDADGRLIGIEYLGYLNV